MWDENYLHGGTTLFYVTLAKFIAFEVWSERVPTSDIMGWKKFAIGYMMA